MSVRRVLIPTLALAAAGSLVAACAPQSSSTASSSAAPAASSAAAASSAPAASASAQPATPSASAAAALDECSKANLPVVNPGTITIGTDKPAYPPYFVDDDPSNGQGFESAVAYAVAKQLGFEANEVTWAVVPFNKSYAPGAKDFDFDINQISITPKRQKAVDFSDPYYTAPQAVVALKKSPIAGATTVAELQGAKLGAQVGTTSLDYITDVVKPAEQPYVYNDTNDAKSALNSGQIDGIVVDLPTALYITAVEIDNSVIVGQFAGAGTGDQWGLLMQKGGPLTSCVNKALTAMVDDGELASITDQWMGASTAPIFQ